MSPNLDLRAHLLDEFRHELRRPLRELLAAAKRYRRGVRVIWATGEVAWTEVMLAGCGIHHFLTDWRHLGITAEDVISQERRPKTFFLVTAAYAAFSMDGTMPEEAQRHLLDLFRQSALGEGA